jgi:hypothetical protein
MSHDEFIRSSRVQASVRTAIARRGMGFDASPPCMVGQVVTESAAIAVGKFLKVHPVSVLGAEQEGGNGTFAVDDSTTVLVYLVGPHRANQGDMLVCRWIDFEWVADRGGSTVGGHFLSGCPCTNIPDTLYLHVASQPTNPLVRSYAHPATLRWQTRPADLDSYNIETAGYFSDIVETVGIVFGQTAVLNRYRY